MSIETTAGWVTCPECGAHYMVWTDDESRPNWCVYCGETYES